VSVVLAFDCAVSGLGVAVVRDGKPLARLHEAGRDQAARLLPAIKAVLEEAAMPRRDVSLIAVTIGPGSFTGVRVGLAAARGLAIGLGAPLAGFATTSVLLAQARARGRLVVAAVDSHLGDWFCALQSDQAPFVATAHSLAARLQGQSCVVIGSAVASLAADLEARGLQALAEEAVPDPVALARLAAADGEEAWRVRNHAQGLPRPLYLRGVNITLPDGARRTVE
jgi:tRNA threonylcarbamoyladenosine biosynthesis protein TsaB